MGGFGSGRRRKPLEIHELEGTFRRDRHGPRSNERATFSPMKDPIAFGRTAIPENEDDLDEQIVHKGIDVLPDERLLVSASTLEWTLDATAKTIRSRLGSWAPRSAPTSSRCWHNAQACPRKKLPSSSRRFCRGSSTSSLRRVACRARRNCRNRREQPPQP